MAFSREKLLATLRCPGCQGLLSISNPDPNVFACVACNEQFPTINGIPRMLVTPMREALAGGECDSLDERQVRTAHSFGYEWTMFPEMYAEWEQSFLDYMYPHPPEFFRGKTVLDAGCGSGRFAHYAAKYGAEVWAIDLGSAVEVARLNTAAFDNAQVVQADLHQAPFALESFDFIYSIGVLHHLPHPEAAFQNLLRYLKPEGEIQIYLYWRPEGQPIKRALLSLVAAARQVTTRLPPSVVYWLAFPAAWAAMMFFVWPYRLLKAIGLNAIAEKLPMKQYAGFSFRVCVNDQLDRFSAPIENRYTRQDVNDWLNRARLEKTRVNASYGWVGTGRKPTVFSP